MKKIVYILTFAVAVVMAACNSNGESSGASPNSTDANGNNPVAAASADSAGMTTDTAAQGGNEVTVATSDVAKTQPNGAQATPATTTPQSQPFSPEETAKYKEAIELINTYKDEVNKCITVKSGKEIDDATKQRISEIQSKLNELEKAGKMNKKLLDLKKVSDDVYNQILAK